MCVSVCVVYVRVCACGVYVWRVYTSACGMVRVLSSKREYIRDVSDKGSLGTGPTLSFYFRAGGLSDMVSVSVRNLHPVCY